MALLSAVIVGSSGYSVYRYLTIDKGMLASRNDRVSGNINVMLLRSDDWREIATQKLLTFEDFAGIDGSTATIPVTAELARQFCDASDEDVPRYVSHNTTHAAYQNLIYGNVNTLQWYDTKQEYHTFEGEFRTCEHQVRFVLATPPSEEEYALADSEGVTLEVTPAALDGFVFITHKDNPVDSLTVQQIRDIYTGKITNWKEVGGKDEKIRAFQREKNSGSQTAMEELVMNGAPMADAPVAFVPQEMGILVERVAEYENESAAIGYTYYYYINNLYRNPDIKVLHIDGISPDNENLVSGAYPFTAAYYAVIRSDEPEDSVYRALRDYMLTDEGQEIIRMAGYCPVNG